MKILNNLKSKIQEKFHNLGIHIYEPCYLNHRASDSWYRMTYICLHPSCFEFTELAQRYDPRDPPITSDRGRKKWLQFLENFYSDPSFLSPKNAKS